MSSCGWEIQHHLGGIARDVHIASGVFIQIPLAIGIVFLCQEWSRERNESDFGSNNGGGSNSPFFLPGFVCLGIGIAANAIFFK